MSHDTNENKKENIGHGDKLMNGNGGAISGPLEEKKTAVDLLGTEKMEFYFQLLDPMIGPIHPVKEVRMAFIALLLDGKTQEEATEIIEEAVQILMNKHHE